ncbi:MAG: hypothetical protein PHD21_08535 [Flavobacteriales bacterium]|nr:hypothetical protein [Flavobacteriales bacterium]
MNLVKTIHIILSVAALSGAAMFVSCKNDEADVDRLLADQKPLPTEIENYYMERCDSGMITMRMSAGKVVIEQSPSDRNVTDKKGSGGILIISYKKGTDSVEVKLTSNSAIEHGSSGLSEAIGNVIVSTAEKDSILTERLIWDKEKHIFYTDNFARIVRSGDVMLPKKGFKADENFRWYQLFNSSGELSIDDSLSSSRPSSPVEDNAEETPSPVVSPAAQVNSTPQLPNNVKNNQPAKTKKEDDGIWQNKPVLKNGVPIIENNEPSTKPDDPYAK